MYTITPARTLMNGNSRIDGETNPLPSVQELHISLVIPVPSIAIYHVKHAAKPGTADTGYLLEYIIPLMFMEE